MKKYFDIFQDFIESLHFKLTVQSAFQKPAIIHKIFETNSTFYVKQRPTEKVQFLFFRSFWLALKKKKFLARGLGTSL